MLTARLFLTPKLMVIITSALDLIQPSSIREEREPCEASRSYNAYMEMPAYSPAPEISDSDELWMREAIRCAHRALEAGEVPVGAVVLWNGTIVGRGWNRNISDEDPTAHAEIIALRDAGAALGDYRLGDCDLFATIEPCAMCAGALVHARIRRLVYGADDPKAGAVHSVLRVLNHPGLNHSIEVRGGVLAGRCAEILQEFFRAKR